MQIFLRISLGSNEENKKALTPDEKKMAFEMTYMHYIVAPRLKTNRNIHCQKYRQLTKQTNNN